MSADDKTVVGSVSTPQTDASTDDEPVSDSAGESTDQEDETPALPLDQVFEMVKNERRRLTIDYLRDHPDGTTLGELAEHIAAVENDKPVKAISSKERKRVYVGLYQCHLPKMDDLDVIEFNQNRGRVRLGPNAERLYPYIDPEGGSNSPRWARLYLGLAVLGGVSLVGSLAVGPADGVLPALVAGGLVVSVAGCSLFQILKNGYPE